MANSITGRKSIGASAIRSPGQDSQLKGIRGNSAMAAADGSSALDALIHHRIRLGIVSALAGADSLSFGEIKALLKVTDGNLSVHARKLEDAQYVECRKSFDERRPRTDYRLAPLGRKALQRYLNHMEATI